MADDQLQPLYPDDSLPFPPTACSLLGTMIKTRLVPREVFAYSLVFNDTHLPALISPDFGTLVLLGFKNPSMSAICCE